MFDRFTASKKRAGGKRILAIGSVLLHLFLGALLIAMGFWEISEIGRPNRGVAMATTTMPASSGGAEKPAGKKVERAKKLVRESRQPSDRPKEDVKTGSDSDATGTEGDGGDPNATGDGLPGGPGSLGTELCLDPSRCGGDMPSVPKAKDPTPEAKLLPPTVLGELRRVAGDPQIQPPTSTQNAMRQANEHRALAVVKMCLDTQGQVSRAGLVKSSGYGEYDAKLLSKMRNWRYHPYRAAGVSIAICTHVTFIYKQD
jgi:TonB family protein